MVTYVGQVNQVYLTLAIKGHLDLTMSVLC